MEYDALVEKVQENSGLPEEEAADALGMLVENLAGHLPEAERQDFAHQLPLKLQEMALTARAAMGTIQEDLGEQFVRAHHVDRAGAASQISAAWRAIREELSPGRIDDLMSRLPGSVTAYLH